jgi:hypothetical protein
MIYRASSNARPSRPVVVASTSRRGPIVGGRPVVGSRPVSGGGEDGARPGAFLNPSGLAISPQYAMESLDSLMETDSSEAPGPAAGPSDNRLRVTAFATMTGVAIITFVVAAILVFATVHSVYQYFA